MDHGKISSNEKSNNNSTTTTMGSKQRNSTLSNPNTVSEPLNSRSYVGGSSINATSNGYTSLATTTSTNSNNYLSGKCGNGHLNCNYSGIPAAPKGINSDFHPSKISSSGFNNTRHNSNDKGSLIPMVSSLIIYKLITN